MRCINAIKLRTSRHSRESGNPLLQLWISTFMGITGKVTRRVRPLITKLMTTALKQILLVFLLGSLVDNDINRLFVFEKRSVCESIAKVDFKGAGVYKMPFVYGDKVFGS